jgi:myo-inositol-1(or 4)-monophosphatase
MKSFDNEKALNSAATAARAAGKLMCANLHRRKKVNEAVQHDIKLELDVHCQRLIERKLLADFPETAILGEEGVHGDQDAEWRWVIDPIDGTVNFTYGIPHACVAIALQRRTGRFDPARPRAPGVGDRRARVEPASAIQDDDAAYETRVGVVYDPFCDELWTAIRGRPARLNGRIIRPSQRDQLAESIVSLGFAKSTETLEQMLPAFNELLPRVRKIRIMGAAALAMTYVACGRFDAYLETGVRLWDIAAGGLILECAQGEFWHRQVAGEHRYAVIANNGLLRRKLQRLAATGRKQSKQS